MKNIYMKIVIPVYNIIIKLLIIIKNNYLQRKMLNID